MTSSAPATDNPPAQDCRCGEMLSDFAATSLVQG
jgi:hypothetical protein